MKFSLDCRVEVDGTPMPLSSLAQDLDSHRSAVAALGGLEGVLVLSLGEEETTGGEYSEPVLRLLGGWLRKLPWIIGGDTETVALRNSEHCFAFVPAGNGVEISFFEGDEAEIEAYLIDPTTVYLVDFAEATLALGRRMIDLVNAVDPTLFDSDEDCQDLRASFDQAGEAWHDHQLHQRR